MQKTLTIVLPVYNEEANIAKVVTSFLTIKDRIKHDLTLLIVNDGSVDGTEDVSKGLARNHPTVRYLYHRNNVGYGGALISGFRAAKTDYVALADGDGQFDADDMVTLLRHTQRFDVVVGYRKHRADPVARRILGNVWTLLGRYGCNIPVRDLNCGLKVFKRSVLDSLLLTCTGPGINLEVMTQIASAGIPIKEIPCSHFPRTAGKQTGGGVRALCRAVPEFFSVWRLRARR